MKAKDNIKQMDGDICKSDFMISIACDKMH